MQLIYESPPTTEVLCDLCNKQWTADMSKPGGFLFSSKAVCPDCAPDLRRDAEKYHELDHIRASQSPDETFYAFVQRIRNFRPVSTKVWSF